MGKPRQRYTLYDLKVDEVSFCDKGDDPTAYITLFKRAEDDADQGGLPAHIVDDLIAEELAKDEPLGKGTNLTTKSDVYKVVMQKAEEKMAADPELKLKPASARVEVLYENPELRLAYEQAAADRDAAVIAAAATGRDLSEKTAVTKGADTLKKHAAKVEELRKGDPRLSLAEARRLAWTPDLRDEYNAAFGA